MANEVEIFEAGALRGNEPVFPVPALRKQTLTIGGSASSTFLGGRPTLRITTTTTCRVEFGTAPTGSGDTMLIYAGSYADLSVQAGHKVIAVAA